MYEKGDEYNICVDVMILAFIDDIVLSLFIM